MKTIAITAAAYAAFFAFRYFINTDPGLADLIAQTLASIGDRPS